MTAKEISKTQIDRLGDRLKKGDISDDDLRLLDIYRGSFSDAYEFVVERIRDLMEFEPTGRPLKLTESISDKLRRESIRLTQIQDIAGCRLIVADIAAQDAAAQSLRKLFEKVIVIDRRKQPSHGYRAVHVVINCLGKTIEVQIRTTLQQAWAEMSEKFSDVLDPTIKYGGGQVKIQNILSDYSDLVANHEALETSYTIFPIRFGEDLVKRREIIHEGLRGVIENVTKIIGAINDISN